MEQNTKSYRLAELVQALPPELYDWVLALTFTADYETRQIDETYRPPSRMQISHETRKIFAQSYYSRTVFYATFENCRAWVKSFSPSHVRLLSEIRITDSLVFKGDGMRSRPVFLKQVSEAYYKIILPNGPCEKPLYEDMSALSGADLFKFEVVRKADSARRWMSLRDVYKEYVDLSRWAHT